MLTRSWFVSRLLSISTNWCVCMYLYVLGFSKYPSLLKVGISKSPIARVRTLEVWHGKCVSSVFYNMGKTYQRAEKLLHILLEDSNVRVDGDGGTEFFRSEEVFDKVSKVVELCGGQKENVELAMTPRQPLKLKQKGWLTLIFNFLFVDNSPLSFSSDGVHINLKYDAEKIYEGGHRASSGIIDVFNYGYTPVVPNTIDSCIMFTGWVDDSKNELNITIRSKDWFETCFGNLLISKIPLYEELCDFYDSLYAINIY